jgi:hypothetical protein
LISSLPSAANLVSSQLRTVGGASPTERGSAALSTVAAIGMLLVFVTLIVQFAMWQYGRGVLRSATLEAARAGAPMGSAVGACERRFESVRSTLLAGRLGDQTGAVRCVLTDEVVTVEVDARFERWLPISPGWDFTVQAVAVREQGPG